MIACRLLNFLNVFFQPINTAKINSHSFIKLPVDETLYSTIHLTCRYRK